MDGPSLGNLYCNSRFKMQINNAFRSVSIQIENTKFAFNHNIIITYYAAIIGFDGERNQRRISWLLSAGSTKSDWNSEPSALLLLYRKQEGREWTGPGCEETLRTEEIKRHPCPGIPLDHSPIGNYQLHRKQRGNVVPSLTQHRPTTTSPTAVSNRMDSDPVAHFSIGPNGRISMIVPKRKAAIPHSLEYLKCSSVRAVRSKLLFCVGDNVGLGMNILPEHHHHRRRLGPAPCHNGRSRPQHMFATLNL